MWWRSSIARAITTRTENREEDPDKARQKSLSPSSAMGRRAVCTWRGWLSTRGLRIWRRARAAARLWSISRVLPVRGNCGGRLVWLWWIKRSTNEAATWAEVSLSALAANFERLRGVLAGAEVLAVVKAAAYGHGAVACAQALVQAGARWFGVTRAAEGRPFARCYRRLTRVLLMRGVLPGETRMRCGGADAGGVDAGADGGAGGVRSAEEAGGGFGRWCIWRSIPACRGRVFRCSAAGDAGAVHGGFAAAA